MEEKRCVSIVLFQSGPSLIAIGYRFLLIVLIISDTKGVILVRMYFLSYFSSV